MPSAAEKNEALLDAASKGDVRAIEELIAEGADVHARDKYGFTPLHNVAYRESHGDQVGSVIALLERGADINAMNKYFNTPLHEAVFSGRVALAVTLLELGADINVKATEGETSSHATYATSQGETPLHAATYDGNVAMIEALLANGADVNATDNDGKTPLHCIDHYMDHGYAAAIQFLCAEGATKFSV